MRQVVLQPLDVFAPRCSKSSTSTISAERDGRVLIGFGRFDEPVTGVVSLAARLIAGEPLVGLATKPFQASADHTAAVRIRLSKVGRRALRASGQLKVRVVVTAIGAHAHAHALPESRSLTITT